MDFLTYDLKVAALVAVFYMFFRLLLSREPFHRVNRVVLLAVAVASFVLPLCVVTLHKTVVLDTLPGAPDAVLPTTAMAPAAGSAPWWQSVVPAVFMVGVAVTLGRTLYAVLRVLTLIGRSEKHPLDNGITLCVTAHRQVSPFSWMNYIVMNRDDYEARNPAIIAHERGHISQHHSLDVLLVDTLTALQWFNPAMWMLRQDLRAIHEYEADQAVLSQGINMRQYQYLLIQKAVSACGYSVANGITHSTLKNRIHMMLNNKKYSRARLLKLLALAPIVGAALALNARTVTDYVYTDKPEPQQKKQPVKKGRQNGELKLGGQNVSVKADTKIDVEHKETLFIVDGKRMAASEAKSIDPKSIDHIEVLKNEEALAPYIAQYGDVAKAGLIIITTRKDSVVRGSVQESESSTAYEKVFDVVEQMPEYPGGPVAMMKFLMENMRYPETAHKAGVQGNVIVNYVVETDGTISNIKVVKKVSDELDAEAIRVVGTMPKWKPGMQNGKPVRVKYTVPITFRLN